MQIDMSARKLTRRSSLRTRPRATGIAAAVLLGLLVPTVASANPKLSRKIEVATQVYEELLEIREQEVPERLTREARCVAIIPTVIKGAFVWGGRHGKGVLTCRTEDSWSPPIFVKLSGGSFGFQIGAQATDLVLFFMNDKGIKSLLRSKFVLGADASVAAGPLGRTSEASTDAAMRAEIYAYAKARGLFAGLAIEGARLSPDLKRMEAYYGERLWPEQVLFEGAVRATTPESKQLIATLP